MNQASRFLRSIILKLMLNICGGVDLLNFHL